MPATASLVVAPSTALGQLPIRLAICLPLPSPLPERFAPCSPLAPPMPPMFASPGLMLRFTHSSARAIRPSICVLRTGGVLLRRDRDRHTVRVVGCLRGAAVAVEHRAQPVAAAVRLLIVGQRSVVVRLGAQQLVGPRLDRGDGSLVGRRDRQDDVRALHFNGGRGTEHRARAHARFLRHHDRRRLDHGAMAGVAILASYRDDCQKPDQGSSFRHMTVMLHRIPRDAMLTAFASWTSAWWWSWACAPFASAAPASPWRA